MKRLENKVIIVTGATGGIGLASARLFAAEGARLVLVDLDQGALDRAVAEIGGDTLGIAADVADVDPKDKSWPIEEVTLGVSGGGMMASMMGFMAIGRPFGM